MRSPGRDSLTDFSRTWGRAQEQHGGGVQRGVHCPPLLLPSCSARKFHLIRQRLVAPIKLWHSQALWCIVLGFQRPQRADKLAKKHTQVHRNNMSYISKVWHTNTYVQKAETPNTHTHTRIHPLGFFAFGSNWNMGSFIQAWINVGSACSLWQWCSFKGVKLKLFFWLFWKSCINSQLWCDCLCRKTC